MNKDTVQGDLRQGLGAAEGVIGEAVDNLELRLRGKADEIVGRVQSAYGQATDAAAGTVDGVDAFVTERPYLTAAIAAGAGLLLGFVMGLGRPKVIVVRPAPPRA
jgi:uncharacterized protein YjbJ (UPF0337 family)